MQVAGSLEIPFCTSAAVLCSILSVLIHPGQPQGNPWSCSELAPTPSHSSTALSIRNSGDDEQTCLPYKQTARHHRSRLPAAGFCHFGEKQISTAVFIPCLWALLQRKTPGTCQQTARHGCPPSECHLPPSAQAEFHSSPCVPVE